MAEHSDRYGFTSVTEAYPFNDKAKVRGTVYNWARHIFRATTVNAKLATRTR